ncbi:ribosome-associated heat shock protein Hsp15 [Candidatus Parabeggiatoa sp. HSG14]|uniref:ribosome-associated heat shock protein Hsp15 n=1 Tax=Candidatus Parabeggiatoa sp. HSG14 TaxID=3055593 RepID=UPI0025A7E683|nr:ribosome-associated heat shock protein Hsp15 [Thiotrichales bacterium HSG14]
METSTQTTKIRLDKWLWAARFFKTRSLATDAVNGGKVRLNQQRSKPAKEIHLGDELTIRTGYVDRTVIVQGLSKQRRPAKEAVLLYEETAESIENREQTSELHRQAAATRPRGMGRPTKKERRTIHRFTRDTASSKESTTD